MAGAFYLLDAVATGAVSAGTAASYISAEVPGLDMRIMTIVLLVAMAAICMLGVKDSANVALGMVTIHLTTMAMLIVAGIVTWARLGNATLVDNWNVAKGVDLTSGRNVARIVFDGTCIAFVGLTGVESTPSYVSAVKAGGFPRALRNLHISVLLTEPALALLIVATMPMSSIIGTPNILASLGALSGGWLKYIVIVDAVIVLAGGIISGTVGCMGTAQALVNDKILANFFQRALPRTGARWPQIVLFLALCLIMCGTSNFNLTIMSSVCECSSLSFAKPGADPCLQSASSSCWSCHSSRCRSSLW